MVQPEYEYFQSTGPGVWNDSHLFTFFDERGQMEVLAKVGVLPNQKRGHTWLSVWQANKVVYQSFQWDLPLPRGDKGDISLGTLRLQIVEPLQRLHIQASDTGCELDVSWEGIMPAFDLSGSAALGDRVAPHHYEQAGHVHGSVRVGGKTHEVDAYGFRDRSWGERDFSGMAECKVVQANFDGVISLTGMKFKNQRGAVSSTGYALDAGSVSGICEMTAKTDRFEFGRPERTIAAVLTNDGGRAYPVACEVIGNYGYTMAQLNVSHDIIRATLNRKVGTGWIEEAVPRATTID